MIPIPSADVVDKFKLNPVCNAHLSPRQTHSHGSSPGKRSLPHWQEHDQPYRHTAPRVPTPPPSADSSSHEEQECSDPARAGGSKRPAARLTDAPESSKGRRFFVTEEFRHRLVDWLSSHYQGRERFVFDSKAPFTGSSESLAKSFLASLPGPARPNTRTVFNQVKLVKDMYAEAQARPSERPAWFDTWHAMVVRGSCPPSWEEEAGEDPLRLRKRRRSEDEETVIARASPDGAKRTRASSNEPDDPPLRQRADSLLRWAQEVQQPLPLALGTSSDTAAVLDTLAALEQTQLRVLEEVRSLRSAILAR